MYALMSSCVRSSNDSGVGGTPFGSDNSESKLQGGGGMVTLAMKHSRSSEFSLASFKPKDNAI